MIKKKFAINLVKQTNKDTNLIEIALEIALESEMDLNFNIDINFIQIYFNQINYVF